MSNPRILVLDDLFGRNTANGRNIERENLCAHFLLNDITGDTACKCGVQTVLAPVADAVFCRAQLPAKAEIGDVVENDLSGALAAVRLGLAEKGTLPWSMILIDLCFYTGSVTRQSDSRTPGMPEGRHADDVPSEYFGLRLLTAIHAEFPDLPLYILSSKPRGEVSLEFSRRGAFGFIARDALNGSEALRDALNQHGLLDDASGKVVGSSVALLVALRDARRVARHRENVLLLGERGTGKELLASFINQQSGALGGERNRPFVCVNSPGFSQSMVASELFGIEPRTATGVDPKKGLIELADKGDLFLDEMADMPSEVQAAVLRVLQEHRFSRVGGRKSIEVDVRFISATNANLDAGHTGIRSDLLDRLTHGGVLRLPALRERKSDIPKLAEHFIREAEALTSGSLRRQLALEAVNELMERPWYGNVRELRSCMLTAVSHYPAVEYLVPDHLPPGAQRWVSDVSQEDAKGGVRSTSPAKSQLDLLIESLTSLKFDPQLVDVWCGRLPELQHAQSRLLANYLEAALGLTKRRTPLRPSGAIQILPAVRLLTGDQTLTASKAADIIKKLLGPLEETLGGDLREAFLVATRLRPRSRRQNADG
jgi:DNA-binding NtrC family response regulator